MARYSKESIERLRDALDIIDLIGRYVTLKRSGASYKGLCPFHEEKTPSFVVNPVTRRFHCFGCGAHGDPLHFIMHHENIDFKHAVEFLAERYGIQLDMVAGEEKGVPKKRLKDLLEEAKSFFHAMLLYAEEAQEAREYLAKRGFSLSFVQSFGVGYACGQLKRYLISLGYNEVEIREAGLLHSSGRDFFSERITFPILDSMGSTIGFSARKWKEETFGGKYINTQETALFKKSKILFGLFYSKKKMMQSRTACLVEGQLDALRLIEAGFDYTVATLGTAFGQSHVDQLKGIGVEEVYLAFDQDDAGRESSEKAGELLMGRGLMVRVVEFANYKDPDELLLQQGRSAFFYALSHAKEYVPFLVDSERQKRDWKVPQNKDRAIRKIANRIRQWPSPVLVHESLKQLAELTEVPEKFLQVGEKVAPAAFVRPVSLPTVPSEMVGELELIRWLVFVGNEKQEIFQYCKENLTPEELAYAAPKKLYAHILESYTKGEIVDSMNILSECDTEEVEELYQKIMSRPQDEKKAMQIVQELVQKIKQHHWLKKREAILKAMEDPERTEDERLELARKYSLLKA